MNCRTREVCLDLPGQSRVNLQELKDKARTKLRRESFGFVFQAGLLIPELTAEENVAMALMINGTARQAAMAQAGQALAALGLAGMEQRRIGQLSGGQAQRVAIARAQVTGAMVVCRRTYRRFGLNYRCRSTRRVARLHRGCGKVIGHEAHDPSVAERCDRVVKLSDGNLISDSHGAALLWVKPDEPIASRPGCWGAQPRLV